MSIKTNTADHKLHTIKRNIRRTLVGNRLADHSEVVATLLIGAALTTFILDSTAAFNGLDKDSRKWNEKHKSLGMWLDLYQMFDGSLE